METVQENSQGHHMFILWLEDLKNIEQGKKALRTHELGQEKKSPSSWSYQVQQPPMPRNQWPLACSSLYIQHGIRLSCQYWDFWRDP